MILYPERVHGSNPVYFNVSHNQVRLGEHDRSSTGEGRLPMISIDVVKAVNHENYNDSTYENDISILELAEERDWST